MPDKIYSLIKRIS